MQANNPLTRNFIENHSASAARVLETLPAEQCVAFLEEINREQAVKLFHYFMPRFAARCLLIMSNDLLEDCTQQALSEVCRALLSIDQAQQKIITDRLGSRLLKQVQARLQYPVDSVARFFSLHCPVLAASATVGEALRQLENVNFDDGCQINIVSDDHKLLGNIDMARLLSASRKELLGKLISRARRPQLLISNRMNDIASNEGWLNYRQLPVVDRHGVYMGELDYETVSKYQTENQLQPTEAFGGMLSLAGLYWLSASWLVDCLIGGTSRKNREDQ